LLFLLAPHSSPATPLPEGERPHPVPENGSIAGSISHPSGVCDGEWILLEAAFDGISIGASEDGAWITSA